MAKLDGWYVRIDPPPGCPQTIPVILQRRKVYLVTTTFPDNRMHFGSPEITQWPLTAPLYYLLKAAGYQYHLVTCQCPQHSSASAWGRYLGQSDPNQIPPDERPTTAVP